MSSALGVGPPFTTTLGAMEADELSRTAEAYVKRYAERVVVDKDNVFQAQDINWWAEERFQQLVHDDPETLWLLIQRVLELTEKAEVLGILAAGPVENLINFHGPAFIERIERKAANDARFRELLWGVWRSSTPDVWARVESARA
jgi:hypothetical protein